jgi:hypothetical protein
MDKRPILLLVGLFVSTALFAQAYRWVDDQGVVHYSDRPQPGAERIHLPKSSSPRQSTRSRSAAAQDTPSTAAAPEAPFRYESLSQASPAPEETLWNIEGTLNVSLALQPALQPGHQLHVYFDGEPRVVTGTSFTLQEVYRGAHTLQAEVRDETGKLMIRSDASRFYVQQNKVQF